MKAPSAVPAVQRMATRARWLRLVGLVGVSEKGGVFMNYVRPSSSIRVWSTRIFECSRVYRRPLRIGGAA